MTAVLNGKQVLAPPKDIAEVKNAYEIYERLDELDPYSVDDLLTAHGIMTRGLVEESGMFRTRPVGVVDQEGHVLHFGTLPQYVPDLVMELLDWAKHSDLHMLIRSCVFHYELELIHPFADGNGRVGRLIMFKELLRIDALPVLVHDAYRAEYVNGISKFPDEPGWLVDTLLFERDLYRSHVLKTDAEALRYTYHDQWNMAEHRVERDEDLEFAKLIDTKAQPLFDEEYQQRERLLWGE